MARAAGSRSSLLAWLALPVLLLAAALLAWGLHVHAQRAALARELLRTYPQDIDANATLVSFAGAEGRALYARNCVGCHGAHMQGTPQIGAPALVGGHWLWGNGSVFQIERILLYGIRSGQSQALNETEMPAFGLMGKLSSGQVQELVQYLMKLNHRPYDAEAANAGQMLFYDNHYGCYDCHGTDAKGDADYGAPNLTTNYFANGGSEQDIYTSIFYGRHRVMPAWKGRLSLDQIRALAVYVHEISKSSAGSSTEGSAGNGAERSAEGG